MVGISEIAEGDEGEEFLALIPPNISVEELHPDDQDLIWWYEMSEPALPPWTIDPVVRAMVNAKRKK